MLMAADHSVFYGREAPAVFSPVRLRHPVGQSFVGLDSILAHIHVAAAGNTEIGQVNWTLVGASSLLLRLALRVATGAAWTMGSP
jgi:hypothetical protein